MAVEIPVVVDIEKAFTEAAKRVSTAMKPMQMEIKKSMEGMDLTVGYKRIDGYLYPIKKSLKEIVGLQSSLSRGETRYSVSSMKELTTALESAKREYMEMAAVQDRGVRTNGIRQAQLREAITILSSEIALRQRRVQLVEKAAQREIAAANAIDAGNYALKQEVKTAADLNDQISALRGKLQHLDPKSKEWTNTAKEIKKATAKLEEYNAKLNAVLSGTSTRTSAGSINRISKEMDGLISKWNSMSSSVKFDANGQLSAKAQDLVQKYRELTAQSERYGRSLQDTARIAVPAMDSVSQKLRTQSGIFRMLTSYMSIYTAIFAGMRFIRNIRETTAEFEMQRVALGGIIQDAEKANSLFREIKAAAIESPFQIKDLVKYTKQLSAYRVETENLFKVTMKLADVSAGLGVDMNRLILAYGQVRAAAVLRGQELRQFTEAGIPMVELLAKKFQELGREGTTTADVFELISKRAVPFSMIADIFDDMTERGGVFYKMQEKQAETLKGQWSNLKDSLSIMYDEIGNTSAVHGAMSTLINDAKWLFQNWRYIANAIKISTSSFLAFKTASLFLPNLKRELLLSKKAQDAFTRSQQLAAFAADSGSKTALAASVRLKNYATLMQMAALETNFFKRAWIQLKAVMASTSWISLVVTALSAIATVYASIAMASVRMNKELRRIGVEGQTSINRSIANFTRLADVAANAADGSKEQADAVAELKRTYGDIIPTQELESQKLQQLKGDYDALTVAIRQKISEQIREQKVNTVTDEFGKTIQRKQKKTKDLLASYGLDKEQINAVFEEIQNSVDAGLISIESTAIDRAEEYKRIIKDLTGVVVDFGNGFRDLSGNWHSVSDVEDTALKRLNALTDTYLKMDGVIKGIDNSMEMEIGTFGKFAKMAKQMEKDVANVFVGPEFGDPSTYAAQQQKIKRTVMVYWDYIYKAFEEANKTTNKRIDIGKAFLGDGKIDFEAVNEAVKEAMAGGKNTRLNTFINSIQQEYERLVPSDRIVNLVREKVGDIAEQFSVPMEKAHMYFKDSETSMEDWVKSLQEAQKEHESLYKQMLINNDEIERGNMVLKAFSEAEVEAEKNMNDFLTALISFFSEFKKHQQGPAYQQDPFISQMQDRMKFMQDFKKGYDDLNKYLSSNDALGRVADKMAARGLALGIDEAQQKRAAKELSEWYGEAMEEAFQAAKKYGASGSIREFLSMPIKDKSNRSKALKEFQNLIQSLFDAKTDLDISNLKKEFDDALKRLKDEIKHSETAKNFMNDIFDLTGNKQLATDLAVSVYGTPGDDLEDSIKKMLAKSFVIDSDAFPLMDPALIQQGIFKAIDEKDVVTLRKMLKYVVDDNKHAAEEIISNWEKEEADWLKNLYKTYEKAKTFQERKDLVRDRATATRNRINADRSLSDAEKNTALKAVDKQEARDIADIEIEALKTTYEWTAAFKDMERVSTATLKELVKLLDEYIEKNKETASPESLKTLTQAREQAHDQIVERNGYEGLVKSMSKYFAAQKKVNTLKKQGKKGTKEYRQALDEEREALKDAQKSMKAISDSFDTLGGIVSSVSDMLDLDELSDGRAVLEGIATGLSLVGTALIFINAMFTMLETNPIVLAISSIIAGVAALASIMSNLNVAKANREIEQQNKLLHQLEYNYDRLAAAIEKSFGSEYIYNYTKQLEILTAKQAAYNAQARAEESKGKKADQDRIQEYEDSARDAADQIEEMRHQLSEFFSGTDLTAAAEDFADAWIEAYKEFSSTTDAMSEKFNDMIQSMINKSLAAKIMQEMLQPIFDQIDELAKDGLLSTNDIAEIAALAQSRIPLINDAMTNLMTGLAAAGLDVRNATAGFHGISKEIASASEESILALAAGINTQNFYMSYMPTISENVSQILAAMTGTISPTAPVETTENGDVMPSVQKMVYDYLPTIDQRLMNIENLFKSVVTSKSGTSTNTNCVAVR